MGDSDMDGEAVEIPVTVSRSKLNRHRINIPYISSHSFYNIQMFCCKQNYSI